jgi:hypothetical protein
LNLSAAAGADAVSTLELQCPLVETGDDHQIPDAAREDAEKCDVRIEMH